MPLVTSSGRQLQPAGEPSRPEDRQRLRFVLALILFLSAIGVVAYKRITAGSMPEPTIESSLHATVPTASLSPQTSAIPATTETAVPEIGTSDATGPKPQHEKQKGAHSPEKGAPASVDAGSRAPTITRKVLPPLAVEVFAGGRSVPLQSNSTVAVHVDTSGGIQGRAATPGGTPGSSGGALSDSGRVRISAEALQVLSHPVDPNYPLLAREMKVQGSVILDALIGRDGSIQALKIVSGPTILATAAMEAVRQWRFKPYLQAGQAVETEARITVNFTISTT